MIEEIIKYIDEIMSVTDDRNLELVKRKIQQLIKQTMEQERIKHYLDRMDAEVNNGDYESGHINADEILTDFLKELGYLELVDKYKEVGKWYS